MPWYVFLAGAAVVLPSFALTVDYIRRRGLPRLSLPPSGRIVRIRVPSFAQLGVIAFAITAIFVIFLPEQRIGGLRLEMWSLFASLALFVLAVIFEVLGVLFRRLGLPLVMIVLFVVIMLAGLAR